MKRPRFSLRTMLVAVALIAAVMGWLRYESQRGWTVGKLEGLIAREFDRTWDYNAFARWGQEHGFETNFGYRVEPADGPFWTLHVSEVQGANLGLFAGRGEIEVYFYFGENKKFNSFAIEKHYGDRVILWYP